MKALIGLVFAMGVGIGSAEAADPSKKFAGKNAEWLVKKLPAAKDTASKAALITEMGTRRDPSLMPHLVHAAGDAEREVRAAAIAGLAAYGPQLADTQRDRAYIVGLQDAAPDVLNAAKTALAARLQAAAEPGIDDISSQLSRLGKSGQNWQTRKAAVELMARMESDDAASVDAVILEVARVETHSEVRRAAVMALGTRAVEDARPMLSKIRSKDPEEQVRMAAEDALRKIGGPATSVVVAVLPFETKSKKLGDFTVDLQDFFTSSLAAAEVAEVVERRQVTAIMSELSFQDDNIDDGQAVKVGQMLRAGQVVTGSIQVNGDEVTCLAKRIDVESGKVWSAQPAVGASHDLSAVKRDCAKRLMGSF